MEDLLNKATQVNQQHKRKSIVRMNSSYFNPTSRRDKSRKEGSSSFKLTKVIPHGKAPKSSNEKTTKIGM